MQQKPRYKRFSYAAGLTVLLLSLLCTHSAFGQNILQRDDFLANRPGDSLWLENLIAEDTIALILRADQQDTARFRRIMTGFGSWTIKRRPGAESVLESIQLADGWEYRFDQPIPLLPTQFKTWQQFSGESGFVAYFQGARRGRGVFQLNINVQHKDSARTPLRNFGDCIVLVFSATSTGANCPKINYKFKEWHARDIGLVKLAGNHTSRGLKVETTRIASNLIAAQLQGETLEGIE